MVKKGTWITIVILIGIIAISYYAININGHIIENTFAKCISEKATLYMQTGCFACMKQEEVFGESYSDLTIVNCAEPENYDECFVKNKISLTPTWIIDYEQYIGYKTLEQLSELTGCPLEVNKNGTD